MSIVPVYDAMRVNIGKLPHGQQWAGYTTGSPEIRWASADFAAHPRAVRICQDATASDATADALDDETGAATDAAAADWVPRAQAAYRAAKRPGQRRPAIYKSAAGITALVNTLVAHGIKSGVNLWVAHWGEADAAARAEVRAAAGPFPVVGIQNHSFNADDESWMSQAWLDDVSRPVAPVPRRHLTQAGDTIASIASGRRMTPDGWLALQAHLGADVHTLSSAPLAAGITWLSVNP